jgi:hypothetical protein
MDIPIKITIYIVDEFSTIIAISEKSTARLVEEYESIND